MQALAKRASIAKKNNKGFSLVELIIVIAIMAVLVAILAPQMIKYVEKTRIQKDASAISEVVEAARIAVADEKVYETFTATKESQTIIVTNGGATYGGDADTLLKNEVTSIVPTPIKFASKKYAAYPSGVTITVKVDKTTSAITVKSSDVPVDDDDDE